VEIAPTPPGWLEAVLSDFDSFLKDHASCEKKASGMALNIASHYPNQPGLLRAKGDQAVEELTHYLEVVRLLLDRGSERGRNTICWTGC
jgi:tRNA-(ms[2]io[6]A)-hydroxylase